MKKKTFLIGTAIVCIICGFFGIVTSCGGGNGGEKTKEETVDSSLNVSIYIDLSDRLIREMTPSQMDKDTAIVSYIAKLFVDKSFDLKQKLLQSKNRIRVFFYPTPNNSQVESLANDLDVNLGPLKPGEKKAALLGIKEKFSKSLEQIYSQTIEDKKWAGSDIWGFFAKKVETQCIQENSRNILVILTDGYIFDMNNKQKVGNAYSYILPATLNNPNSSLIVSKTGLDNLEVLMLEINPYDVQQGNKMMPILEKWFKEMGVKHFVAVETALTNETKTAIDSFFN